MFIIFFFTLKIHFCNCAHSASPYSLPQLRICSLGCLCLAQTRAKRLILALRLTKLSQLSAFSFLSATISSNTLPGWCYGHQRKGHYFWPLCARNSFNTQALNICPRSSWTCHHIRLSRTLGSVLDWMGQNLKSSLWSLNLTFLIWFAVWPDE